jgi:DNA-binding transcriptional regulator YbjK
MNRREKIIQAGLTILRSHGFPGFTQPRVAAEAGIRQSHLTYYFPTRVDLLTAVARAAIDGQLAAIDSMLEGRSIQAASAVVAHAAGRRENTRVIIALAQAADQEPALRELFRELADGIIQRSGKLLDKLNIPSTNENRFLLHALSVGLAVIDLAVARPDGERRSSAVVAATLTMMKKGSSNEQYAHHRRGRYYPKG